MGRIWRERDVYNRREGVDGLRKWGRKYNMFLIFFVYNDVYRSMKYVLNLI